MVQLRFCNIVIFASTLQLGVLAAPWQTPQKRTVQQVEIDLANISSNVTTWNNGITVFFEGPTALASALRIHNATLTLDSAIKQVTTDLMNTGRVTEAEGDTIVQLVKTFEPNFIQALGTFANKRVDFDALPVAGFSGIVKGDLIVLNADTIAFENAFTNAVPADIPFPSKAALDTAFAFALAAYANA